MLENITKKEYATYKNIQGDAADDATRRIKFYREKTLKCHPDKIATKAELQAACEALSLSPEEMEPIITGDDSTFQLRKQKPFTMLKKACDVLANPENFNIDRSEQMTAPQAERNKQSAAAEKVAAEKVAAEKARERAEKFQAYKTTKPQDAEGIEKLQAQVENLVKRLYPDATVFVSAPSEPSSFPSITIKSALFSSLMGLSLSNLENVSGIATVNYNLPQNTVIFTIKNSRARAPALKVVQNGNR